MKRERWIVAVMRGEGPSKMYVRESRVEAVRTLEAIGELDKREVISDFLDERTGSVPAAWSVDYQGVGWIHPLEEG